LDAAPSRVDWENDVPDGVILHVPWFVDAGLRVTDLWESADDFQRYVGQRLLPAVQAIGIEGQPRVDIRPLHSRVFAPAIENATTG
jgi:hypothetical protein